MSAEYGQHKFARGYHTLLKQRKNLQSPLGHQRGYVLVTVMVSAFLIAAIAFLMGQETTINANMAAGEFERDELRYVTEAGIRHAQWVADQSACANYGLPATPFGEHSYSAAFTPVGGSPITITTTGVLENGNTGTHVSSGTTIYDSPVSKQYQPEASNADDAFIDAFNPDWNYGSHQTLRVRGGSMPRHSLMRFDVGAVPAGAKIASAVLHLNAVSISGGGAVGIRRVSSGWIEGTGGGGSGSGVSWIDRDAAEPWMSAGGDYDASSIATSVVSGAAGAWHQWDVTALVSAWRNGSTINNGLILLAEDSAVDVDFHSSDGSDGALRPKLVLSYACECGVGGATGSITLQPNSSIGNDASIVSNPPTINISTNPNLSIKTASGNDDHSLIVFDVSAIPTGATANAATLTLNANSIDSTGTVNVHRVTSAWQEAEATWNNATSGTNWASPGGDYDAIAVDNQFVSATGTVDFDVTSTVGAWLQDSSQNYGLLLRTPGPLVVKFDSSDSAIAGNRPALAIDFTCPCGVDCSAGSGAGGNNCDADFAAKSKESEFSWTAGAADIAGIDFLPEGAVINGVTIPAGGGWIMIDRNKDKFFISDVSGSLLTEFASGFNDPRGVAYVEAGTWAGRIAVADKGDDAIYFMDLDGVVLSSFTTAGITTDPYGLTFIGETESNVYDDHLAISSNKNGIGDTNGGVYIVDQSGVLKKSLDVDTLAPRPQGVAHLTGSDKLLVADRDGLVTIIDFNGFVLRDYNAAEWGFTEMQGITIHPETCEHVIIDKKAFKVALLGQNEQSPASGANLLMVVDNSNILNAQDISKIALIESWGYTVRIIDDNASKSIYDLAVAENDVAFITQEILTSKLGNKLVTAPIGVVTEEDNLTSKFGFSSTIGWNSGVSLIIDDNTHYITQPFALEALPILANAYSLAHTTGTLAPQLRELGLSTSGPALVTLEAGATMFNALLTDGRRVQLPWGDSNFDIAQLNTNGETIMKRALEWGVQPPPRCDAAFVANNLAWDSDWPAGATDVLGIDFLPAGLIVNGVTLPGGGGWILSDKSEDRLFVTDLAGNPLTDFPINIFDSQGVILIDAGYWIHYLAVADKGAKYVYYLDLDGNIVGAFSTKLITTNPLGLSFIGATASAIYDNHLAISSDKDASGGGTAAIYIVDQAGALKKTIDIESFAPKPHGVAHITGSDKLLVADQDGMISIIDFDGTLLYQYFASNFGLTKLTEIALHPDTCEHVIVDDDTRRIARLDASAGSGSGGGPQYVQTYVPWETAASDTWEVKNLGIFGVPSNAVVEVAIINQEGGKEIWGGVRAVGSSLERRLELHEADGGGMEIFVMHAQADAAGRIEHYRGDSDKLTFVLLGYWTESAYVETWDVINAGTNSTWSPKALDGYGVGNGQVAEIAMVNNDDANEVLVGVRPTGSSLSRTLNLHEAKDGGDDVITVFSTADSGTSIDVYAENDASVDFYLAGYWTVPPGNYTDAFVDLGQPAEKQVWEDLDLSSAGVPASAVVQLVLANDEDGAEVLLGVRSRGSFMSRLLEPHQGKNGGQDMAAAHVNADADSIIQRYDEDVGKDHVFYLLGWWD